MSDYIHPVKGMWLTNVQFLGGGVTEGKAYQVTCGEGDRNPAINHNLNETNDFGFVDDKGRYSYSSTDPTLFVDEWRLSTPEEIEDAQA